MIVLLPLRYRVVKNAMRASAVLYVKQKHGGLGMDYSVKGHHETQNLVCLVSWHPGQLRKL